MVADHYIQAVANVLGTSRANQRETWDMELRNTYDTVKFASFVSLRSSIVLGLTGAELAEILGCFGNYIFEQFHFNPTQLLP